MLTIYEIKKSNTVDSLFTKEYVIYGSARLGYMQDKTYIGRKTKSKVVGSGVGVPVVPTFTIPFINPFILPGTTTLTPVYFGNKRYELNDWLGNVRVVVNDLKTWNNSGYYTPNVWSVADYYAFGSEIKERSYVGSDYRFGYGSHEKIDEVSGSGNTIDMGDRWLDVRLGRTPSPDPHKSKYPFISPYSYAINNPLNVFDPDGKDVYLVIWATSDGKIGHAGIAVDNYKSVQRKVIENGKEVTKMEYVKDGTVTYYDLWPGTPVGAGNANKDVDASYNVIKTTLNDIQNTDITGLEGYAPEGVIKLTTDYATDQKTIKALEKFKSTNDKYNGVKCNCSDFAEEGVETAVGKQLDVDESIMMIYKSTTPNKLYKETAKQPNATILKDAGNKVDNTFIDGVKGSNSNSSSDDTKKSNGGSLK